MSTDTTKKQNTPLTTETRAILEKMQAACVGTITRIDLRGHAGRQENDVLDLSVEPTGYEEKWSHKYWKDVVEKYKNHHSDIQYALDIDSERYAELTLSIIASSHHSKCSHCGEAISFIQKNDTLIALEPCAHPGGLPAYSVALDVPSGEIVFANDLRELTNVYEDFDVNTKIGVMKTTQSYADDGMAHIFVGNTCPSVYKNGNSLTVSLDNQWEEDEEETSASTDDLGTHEGSICTDLWWYSAMDKDLFEARCAEEDVDPQSFDFFTVSVPPGTYSFSDELADRDANGIVHLSHIQYTTQKAPVLKQRFFGQATSLADSQFWGTIERFRKLKMFGNNRTFVLADILTTLGNGFQWNKGNLTDQHGKRADTPYKTEEGPVDTPRSTDFIPLLPGYQVGFRAAGVAYPMGFTHNRLLLAPEDADPYWLAGAMMYLKSALSTDFDLIGKERLAEDVYEKQKTLHQNVMIAALDRLSEIAQVQGLDTDGTLEHIFDEIIKAWEQ